MNENYSLISSGEVLQRIEQACYSKILDLSGSFVSQEAFDLLMQYDLPPLQEVLASKEFLTEVQGAGLCRLVNSNRMKGVKLLNEKKCSFGKNYTDWHKYHQQKKNRCMLHEVTKCALSKFDKLPITVIDLGAGTGQETMALLELGCTVYAIEADIEAAHILYARARSHNDHFTLHAGPFIDFKDRLVDFLIAGFAIPYRPLDDFPSFWKKMTNCIKQGGWFAGHFFGPPAECDPAMTYHTPDEIIALLDSDFSNISIWEGPCDELFGGTIPHWGTLYHVLAKKKGAD